VRALADGPEPDGRVVAVVEQHVWPLRGAPLIFDPVERFTSHDFPGEISLAPPHGVAAEQQADPAIVVCGEAAIISGAAIPVYGQS
jgi:hypothetical protein